MGPLPTIAADHRWHGFTRDELVSSHQQRRTSAPVSPLVLVAASALLSPVHCRVRCCTSRIAGLTCISEQHIGFLTTTHCLIRNRICGRAFNLIILTCSMLVSEFEFYLPSFMKEVLTSTKCTSTALANCDIGDVPRSRSAMRVPRPGPSSTSFSFDGQPSCCH